MIDVELLQKEIYVIPVNNKTIIYAPLTRNFCLYNGVAIIKDVDKKWIIQATNLDNVPDFIKKGFGYDYHKIKLRINITNRCNLHCVYCSIGDVKEPQDMSIEMGLCSIKCFIEYAKRRGIDEIEMTFSGGEPTLNIKLITEIIRFAKNNSSQLNISPRILTNGLFNQKEMEIILSDIDGIQVSWDGDFQNNQRYGDNKTLVKQVRNNLKFLCNNGFSPSILAVISECNYRFLEEFVNDTYQEFSIQNIFFVLKDNLGRAVNKKDEFDLTQIGEDYINIWRKYRSMGIDINFSGTDVHSISFYPCSMPHPNYSISPSGVISSCTVTFNEQNADAELFEIGKVNGEQLFLNEEKIKTLSRFNILNMPDCQNCFAKWHCRGGCTYAKHGDWFSSLNQEACGLIQRIVKEKLLTIIMSEHL